MWRNWTREGILLELERPLVTVADSKNSLDHNEDLRLQQVSFGHPHSNLARATLQCSLQAMFFKDDCGMSE